MLRTTTRIVQVPNRLAGVFLFCGATAILTPSCHLALGDFEGAEPSSSVPVVESPVCPEGESASCSADKTSVNCSGGTSIPCTSGNGDTEAPICAYLAGTYRCKQCSPGERGCDIKKPHENKLYACDEFGKWVEKQACTGDKPVCDSGVKACATCIPKSHQCRDFSDTSANLYTCQVNTTTGQPEWVRPSAPCSAATGYVHPFCKDYPDKGDADCLECDEATWAGASCPSDTMILECKNGRLQTSSCEGGKKCVEPTTGPAICQ